MERCGGRTAVNLPYGRSARNVGRVGCGGRRETGRGRKDSSRKRKPPS
jgi:hypothetical protein